MFFVEVGDSLSEFQGNPNQKVENIKMLLRHNCLTVSQSIYMTVTRVSHKLWQLKYKNEVFYY